MCLYTEDIKETMECTCINIRKPEVYCLFFYGINAKSWYFLVHLLDSTWIFWKKVPFLFWFNPCWMDETCGNLFLASWDQPHFSSMIIPIKESTVLFSFFQRVWILIGLFHCWVVSNSSIYNCASTSGCHLFIPHLKMSEHILLHVVNTIDGLPLPPFPW